MRFRVKERLLTIKDDFVVRDDTDEPVYNVNGSLLRFGDQFKIVDRSTGEEVLVVRERVFTHSKQYDLFRGENEVATIRYKKEPDFSNNYFEISSANGMVFQLRGNFKEWDFEVLNHYGHLLGHIHREFAFFGDLYTVDVVDGVDAPFMIAVAVVLDEMKEDRIKTETKAAE